METLSNTMLEKLAGLLAYLKRSRTDFEMLADEIENPSLKTALNNLSQESYYYAGELRNYLNRLGVNNSVTTAELQHGEDEFSESEMEEVTESGNELNALCNTNENLLTKAYSELLTEPLPLQSLKEIIMYQLNALTISFLKIKTLNTARFILY